MKKIRYLAEYLALRFALLIFRLMPLDAASATGGGLGRAIGPRLAASRKAMRNLENALPELTADERREIVRGMWDNLGRVIAEYPHLEQIVRERLTVTADESAARLMRDNAPCMMIGAHCANWEVGGLTMYFHFGKTVDLTYRAPNNPWVDERLLKLRTLNGLLRAHAKSRSGGQELIRAMREGRYTGMLIDQKYNEGLAVPFFNRPAMTNPAFVQLSVKFGYHIVPWQVERLKGAHFHITIYPPLETKNRETVDVMADAHQYLERWIRKRPEQWLWLHRRWGPDITGESA